MQNPPVDQAITLIPQLISALAPGLSVTLIPVTLLFLVVSLWRIMGMRYATPRHHPEENVLPRREKADIVIEATEAAPTALRDITLPSLEKIAERALTHPQPTTLMALVLSEAARTREHPPAVPPVAQEVGSPPPYSPYNDPKYYQKEEHWRRSKPAGS